MSVVKYEFDPKNMPYRRLGPSGLRVPVFSLGGWLTLGGTVVGDLVKEIIKVAYENGINMFDTAEGYAKGRSEVEMSVSLMFYVASLLTSSPRGRVIKELGYRRTDLIITTKLFFGTRSGPNDTGLSRKHIIEGTQASLERLDLDYVDVIFAHRPDYSSQCAVVLVGTENPSSPPQAFYWATSEWSARDIEEAYHVADKLNLIAPIAEQCQHHMFHRERPEREYAPVYKKYAIGTTVWSALASGLLTGKYNNGIPENSRFATHSDFFKDTLKSLSEEEGRAKISKVQRLTEFAETELGCSVTHLALAWVAKNPNTSTVILGASKPEQVVDNLKALDVIPKLTPEVLDKIEAILDNKPAPIPTFGRPSLDPYGRA
ncbi:NADP-dependent oxidoreductase domain-containing protein [Lanmaoa asiatica]|nr:NADP-dependent oxidoreductase domain-containing protein [Lanmaoa asiatica]